MLAQGLVEQQQGQEQVQEQPHVQAQVPQQQGQALEQTRAAAALGLRQALLQQHRASLAQAAEAAPGVLALVEAPHQKPLYYLQLLLQLAFLAARRLLTAACSCSRPRRLRQQGATPRQRWRSPQRLTQMGSDRSQQHAAMQHGSSTRLDLSSLGQAQRTRGQALPQPVARPLTLLPQLQQLGPRSVETTAMVEAPQAPCPETRVAKLRLQVALQRRKTLKSKEQARGPMQQLPSPRPLRLPSHWSLARPLQVSLVLCASRDDTATPLATTASPQFLARRAEVQAASRRRPCRETPC